MGTLSLCAEADTFRHAEKDFSYAVRTSKEMGFKFIEPEVMTGRCLLNVYGYCNITSLEDDPMDMRQEIEAAGMKPACLSAHSALIDTAYGLDYLKKAIRYAYILGAPIVNTAEGPKPEWMTDDEAFRLMKHNLKELLRLCANYGITLTIEPHGVYTTNAEGLLRIMSLSDSPHLAINFDTGNVAVAGNDSVATLKAVVKHVRHVHVKDIVRTKTSGHATGQTAGCAIGDGEVDIKGCIRVLKDAGYSGCLSIECDGIEALKRSVKFITPLL
jgi:sugar phosphate isomerase/epimerase